MEPSNGALYNASNRLHIIAGPPASISAGGITLPNTVGNGPVNVGATRVAVRTFIYTLEFMMMILLTLLRMLTHPGNLHIAPQGEPNHQCLSLISMTHQYDASV